jgi:NADPH:quinone reductase-like Zn-dependent oxidoreductase
MKAVQIEKYGPAESLAIVDVDMPVPGPDDVIIRVYATGVNRLDLLLREGSVFQVAALVRFGRTVRRATS